jgi:hypothetical protein
MFIECGACGALIHVEHGQTPEQAAIEHRESADHTRPGS